jgi:hypothetical protein
VGTQVSDSGRRTALANQKADVLGSFASRRPLSSCTVTWGESILGDDRASVKISFSFSATYRACARAGHAPLRLHLRKTGMAEHLWRSLIHRLRACGFSWVQRDIMTLVPTKKHACVTVLLKQNPFFFFLQRP